MIKEQLQMPREFTFPPATGESKFTLEESNTDLVQRQDFSQESLKTFTLNMIDLLGGKGESASSYGDSVYSNTRKSHILHDRENGKKITFKQTDTNYDNTSTGTGIEIIGDLDTYSLGIQDDQIASGDTPSKIMAGIVYTFSQQNFSNYLTGETKPITPQKNIVHIGLPMAEVQQICSKIFDIYQREQYPPINPS